MDSSLSGRSHNKKPAAKRQEPRRLERGLTRSNCTTCVQRRMVDDKTR
jgi:hypothetical protein